MAELAGSMVCGEWKTYTIAILGPVAVVSLAIMAFWLYWRKMYVGYRV
jgi:hypothetical protein